jgi:hypothetical protein
LYASGRAHWEKDYPTNGLNFKLWNQIQKKGDSSCVGGIYVDKIDMCFRYKVLTQICVLAKFTRDPTKNTFSWIHTGGCFEDDANANYVDAAVGDVYDFKNIQFEVREDMRANAEAAVEEPEAEPEDLGDDISEGESTKK